MSDMISKKPLVSVLISAYNHENYIGRCLRSLLEQSLSSNEYEIIVINDGSTDSTSVIVRQFTSPHDPFIKLIDNHVNLGLPSCLNKGIDIAQGKFLIRVDSDDYVNHIYLEALSYFLESHAFSHAVACDYYSVDESETILGYVDCFKSPIGCGIMFKLEALKEIGGYDNTFKCREEEDLRIRFEKKYRIHHLPLPLYRYRKHDSNMTSDLKKMQLSKILLDKKYN